MQDKTKKLLKKGLRLGGAIGLTTLVLGGSFLLGFATGKATYQPKEEKSLSAAKPKQALQPKRAQDNAGMTAYMTEIVKKKDLFLLTREQFLENNPLAEHEELQFTLYGEFRVSHDYASLLLEGETFTELHIGIDYDSDVLEPSKRHQLYYTDENDNYWSDENDILTINEITGYSDVYSHLGSEQSINKFSPDNVTKLTIGRVTNQPYVEVDGNTYWTSLSSNSPYGMSLARVSENLETNPPLQANNIPFKWGVEIGGVYFPVLYFDADWWEVPGNTAIAGFGTTFRTNQNDEYKALPFIKMAVAQGYYQVFTYNDWALPGVGSITTDGFTDFWKYGNGETTAKIYIWGSMLDSWNVYPNGQMGYKNNAEYLESGKGTWKNWEPESPNWYKDEPTMQDVFTLIGGALTGAGGIFALSVLPGITLGTLLLVPFVVTMIIVIIKMLRK